MNKAIAFGKWFSKARKGASPSQSRPRAQIMEALEARVMLSVVPNDPLYPNMWHLNNTGGTPFGAIPGVDVDAQRAWQYTTGSNEVVIAVLDTGLDIHHPDIFPNLWTNPGETPNGLDDDGNGFIDDIYGWNFIDNTNDVTDYNGHGTHVAGTIGAVGNNGIGVTGVAWNVKILPVQVLGEGGGSDESIIAGIEYITMLKHQGVNIVAANLSLGGAGFPSPTFDKAVADAGRAGILLIMAAGNEAGNNDINQVFPAKFALNHPHVISVAATDSRDELWRGFDPFSGQIFGSNFGMVSVNVGAPGALIASTWSRYVDANRDGLADGLEYNTITGTSMATPVVSGIIALMASANPMATPQQLKAALFNGVELIPALGPYYSLPEYVSTGGRVNALYSVRSIQNQFATADFVSRGNWVGLYGADGQFVVGHDTLFPDYVGVTLTGGTGHVVAASSADTRMLRMPSNPNDRIGAYFTSPDVMTFDFEFKDNEIHRVGLYMADYEVLGRAQVVRIIDKESGRVLDTRTVDNFWAGRYLFWDLHGSVQIQIASTVPGRDAVVSGFFFDTPPANPSAYVDTDTMTRGQWINAYGTAGQFLVGQSDTFPGFVGVNLTGGTGRMVAGRRVGSNPASLQRIDNPRQRTMGYFATTDTMTFDMNFAEGQKYRMAVYVADVEKAGRVQRFDLVDADTNSVIASQTVHDLSGGKYLIFDVSGHVQLRVTRLAGPDAVVSGFFFDAPPGGPATFVRTDANTQGSWIGRYGMDFGYVIGAPNQILPLYVDLNVNNGTTQMINAHTRDRQALQLQRNPAQRMVAYLHTSRTMTIDMDFNDNQTHRVSIYAVDYDRARRVQLVEVVDPSTGQVLSSHVLRDFSKGVYLTWDVRNHVQIRVTRLEGPTAAISGIFFD